jgi:hypothetical protein
VRGEVFPLPIVTVSSDWRKGRGGEQGRSLEEKGVTNVDDGVPVKIGVGEEEAGG